MKRIAAVLSIVFLSLALLAVTGSGLLASAQSAETPEVAAAQVAAQLYSQGAYEEAARAYQQLIDQGYADPALYYNLGLAYAQADELGRAYWSLRNAQELDPRDEEIAQAVTQVETALEDAAQTGDAMLVTERDDPLAPVAELSGRWLTLDELSWLALALWSFFALALLAVLFMDKGTRGRRVVQVFATVSGALLLVAALGLGSRLLDLRQPPAIVIADQVTLAAGPGDQYGGAVTLQGGSEVSVLDQRGDWVEVVASNDVAGWAPADAIAVIAPQAAGAS
jgi:tetratricopeptide (TPR) repeat protein